MNWQDTLFAQVQKLCFVAAGYVDISTQDHAAFGKPRDAANDWQPRLVKVRVGERVVEVSAEVAVERILAGVAEFVQ